MDNRILLVDDDENIHKDFYKILSPNENEPLDTYEAILFGHTSHKKSRELKTYRVDSAYQGKEALKLVAQSLVEEDPYALAFIDMRMPPGWDGVKTIKRIWAIDPSIQIVICSAYSDHSWEEITLALGDCDNLLILKKPFEIIEVKQLALALTIKWELVANLHHLIKKGTEELEHLYSLTRTTLEATEEGIIAVGLQDEILIYNKKFLTQWDLSPEQLSSEKASLVFQHIAKQMEDAILFLKSNILILKEQSSNHKEWKLTNGKTLALYTHPQYLNNETIGMVYSFQDITERKILETQLLHQATHDALTGLPNRALLIDRIKQALAHAKRFELKVGVLLLDLDSFKEINDTLGHEAGDQILKYQAKKLTSFLRDGDTVARLGGDEFVIVLAAQANEHYFLELLNKLIAQFLLPCDILGREIIVTASIGVSIYPQDGDNEELLLKNADSALYHAKEIGRNRFQFYTKEFNSYIIHRAVLKIALNDALIKKELSLSYQPLIDLKTDTIIGLEALLRWNHPTLGLIPPLIFIPIAEESGQIIPIGEWVLNEACTQMHHWHQTSSFPSLKIAVNVSVKQFRQKNFVSVIQQTLKNTKLEPHFLELEITESHMLVHGSNIIKKMIELRALGIKFALDDFGTGYSSLSYLKYFPFDTVKIDKSFIDNITTDSNNATIVQAIISMTKNMGMNVLAEGVENVEQINFLRKHHSNQVQGFYFSKPLTERECTILLHSKTDLFNK
jgi:diguanylate cyclase (GGDEF)-like protein